MSFPDENWVGFAKGWEKRGETGSYLNHKGKEVIDICKRCKHILHVGKEDKLVFTYCPVCLDHQYLSSEDYAEYNKKLTKLDK